MTVFFERHRPMLEAATAALYARGFWTPFPEVPSGKIYGETAKADGDATYAALLAKPFDLPGHPESQRLGAEISPGVRSWGFATPPPNPPR
ncbi:hypothetical protein ACFSHQ_25615 [Gemmobacter lanyuensis]